MAAAAAGTVDRTAPLIELISRLPPEKRRAWIKSRSPEQLVNLKFGWRGVRARQNQLAPEGDWRLWAIIAGRGFGKTRAGAEWLREQWKAGKKRMGLIGATVDDVRDLMVEGPSGICNVGPPHERPVYQMHRRRVLWPDGAKGWLFSADAPERIRGREFDAAWCDETGAWRHEQSKARELRGALGQTRAEDAWNNMLFCMRASSEPQICVTTTPKPLPLIRRIIKEADYLSRGRSHDNRANLSEVYFEIIQGFEGTRIGRQEIGGEILEDVEGALWSLALIEELRAPKPTILDRVVVAVDPPGDNAECGIVVLGYVAANQRSYVLDDRSLAGTPHQWGNAVVRAFDDHQADLVVVEVNFGGPMAADVLRKIKPSLPIKQVHASRGKAIRAEPISTLYEFGKIRHAGVFPKLEDQMTSWVPGMPSPDRLDALVWAATEIHHGAAPVIW